MAVQLVNGVNGLQTVSPPGYQRAYATTTVQVVRQGVLRPATFAQWEALYPGTESQYLGPLYGDPYGETPLVFPQRADERGLIQVWAPEPVRIELRVSVYGYPTVKQVIDLQFTEDPGDTALDALAAHAADTNDPHAAAGYITMAEAEETFLTPATGDELFLTQEEGDQRYAMAALSGISQDAADLRYVNLMGDRMTGQLTIDYGAGGPNLNLEQPNTGLPLTVAYTRSDKSRWQVGVVQGAETGANAGSDFIIARYDDAGNYLSQALTIYRNTGNALLSGDLVVMGDVTWGVLPDSGFRLGVEGPYYVWRRADDLTVLATLHTVGDFGVIGQVSAGNGVFTGANGTTTTISSSLNISLKPAANYVHPDANNARYLGHPSLRWATTFTQNLDAAGRIDVAGDLLSGATITSNGGTIQSGNSAGIYTRLNYNGLFGTIPARMVIYNGFGLSFQPSTGAEILVIENSPDGFFPGTQTMVVNNGNSTHRWAIVYCQNVNTACSEAYKEDIAYLDPDEVLKDVLATPVARFRYKAAGDETMPGKPSDVQMGIIAERTPKSLLTTADSASPMSVAAAGLAGIQALQAQIDTLRRELAEIRGAA